MIRHEIIQAQLLFEQKSNIITDITNNIQNLIKIGKESDAEKFQKEFEAIWETSNVDDLDALSKKIKDRLPRYQIFNDKVQD